MIKHKLSLNTFNLSRSICMVVMLLLLQSTFLAFSTVRAATFDDDDDNNQPRPGNIQARGCFTCDFTIPANSPLNVAPVIERDRMFMAERPGMQRKQIPLGFAANGDLLSGGRYLFESRQQAEQYKHWVQNEFVLDGTLFFDRPYFLNPDCHAWRLIGGHNFQDVQHQVVLRTERWSVPDSNQLDNLKQSWPNLMAAAAQRGLTGVWLLYNREEQLVQIVYFADRVVPPHPFIPDFASLGALESAPSLGSSLNPPADWTKTFDRTQWVLTVWFPFVLGDHGQPSLWPNSPPLPEATETDGVCEVSRGETSVTAPMDCGPLCGNKVCDLGEDNQKCPGDCRVP
jgi:hypothetical protein